MITRGNKHKCYYCGNEEECTKDHFYPKSKGGYLTVYACQVCQSSKKNMMPLDWLKYYESHIAFSKKAKKRVRNTVLSLINYMKENNLY